MDTFETSELDFLSEIDKLFEENKELKDLLVEYQTESINQHYEKNNEIKDLRNEEVDEINDNQTFEKNEEIHNFFVENNEIVCENTDETDLLQEVFKDNEFRAMFDIIMSNNNSQKRKSDQIGFGLSAKRTLLKM